jgi:hypothetical protein
VDSIEFGPQLADYSIGRAGPDGRVWALNRPTPGAVNRAVQVAGPAGLKINEWLASAGERFDGDFVELYNASAKPVALGGVSLTDDPINYPERHRFPDLSFVGPKSYIVLKGRGDSKGADGRRLPFNLASECGWIALMGSQGRQIDLVNYQCQAPGVSRGRKPDGGIRHAYYKGPSPGGPNGAARTAKTGAPPSVAGLRISEIMFHPIEGGRDQEYVELLNVGAAPIPLRGLRFTEGIEFRFPDRSLAPGERVLVVADRTEFEATYGSDLPVLGEYSGKLSNKGETLHIKMPKPSEVLALNCRFKDSWHREADGSGKSLQLTNPKGAANPGADGWRASVADGGSPGKP